MADPPEDDDVVEVVGISPPTADVWDVQPDAPVSSGVIGPTDAFVGAANNNHNHRNTHMSHIDGCGLWRNWQRSFRRPIDALLDLMDNTVDANSGEGRIRISTRFPLENDNQNNGDQDNNDCLLIINSYPEDVHKEMSKVLNVFSSHKANTAMGENGVGVKQASASLANFSLVVTKKHDTFQVGILCVSLQKPQGICIPSYTLEANHWGNELDTFCDTDDIFRDCMQYFGGRPVPLYEGDREVWEVFDDEELQAFQHKGKDRLLQLLDHMSTSDDWYYHNCVFALLLDQIRVNTSVTMLMEELKETLPKTYLHLQKPQCSILIDGVEPPFQYWERRLIELTCFSVDISRSQPVSACLDAPTGPDVNTLRIFIGFDPQRASAGQSCASLYIYSRKSGRRISCNEDCRNFLELSAGGSKYAQGLTIILDDAESSLPLTPTKQDIAWTEHEHGIVHRDNVKAWLRAVTKTYYEHHLETTFGDLKAQLTKAVLQKVDGMKALQSKESVTALSNYQYFSKFENVIWKWHQGQGRIVLSPNMKKRVKIVPGVATQLKFDIPPEKQLASRSRTKKKDENKSNKNESVKSPRKKQAPRKASSSAAKEAPAQNGSKETAAAGGRRPPTRKRPPPPPATVTPPRPAASQRTSPRSTRASKRLAQSDEGGSTQTSKRQAPSDEGRSTRASKRQARSGEEGSLGASKRQARSDEGGSSGDSKRQSASDEGGSTRASRRQSASDEGGSTRASRRRSASDEGGFEPPAQAASDEGGSRRDAQARSSEGGSKPAPATVAAKSKGRQTRTFRAATTTEDLPTDTSHAATTTENLPTGFQKHTEEWYEQKLQEHGARIRELEAAAQTSPPPPPVDIIAQLNRKIQQLEEENLGMKEELDKKNAEILVLEEQLE